MQIAPIWLPPLLVPTKGYPVLQATQVVAGAKPYLLGVAQHVEGPQGPRADPLPQRAHGTAWHRFPLLGDPFGGIFTPLPLALPIFPNEAPKKPAHDPQQDTPAAEAPTAAAATDPVEAPTAASNFRLAMGVLHAQGCAEFQKVCAYVCVLLCA